MPRPGETQDCRKCKGKDTMVRIREMHPDPDGVAAGEKEPRMVAKRDYWKCQKCGAEDDYSYRMKE